MVDECNKEVSWDSSVLLILANCERSKVESSVPLVWLNCLTISKKSPVWRNEPGVTSGKYISYGSVSDEELGWK